MLPSLLRRMGDSPWKMLAREKKHCCLILKKKTCLFAEFGPCVTERAPHSAGERDKEIKTILFHKACQGHSVEKERSNGHHHVVLQGIDLCCARQFCSSSTNRWHHESQCGVECERKKHLQQIKLLKCTFLPQTFLPHTETLLLYSGVLKIKAFSGWSHFAWSAQICKHYLPALH